MAQECRNLQEPALKTNQTFAQTSPPPDELLFVQMNRPSLVQKPEEPPSTTAQNPQNSPVSQQDQAFTEFQCQQKTCETFAHQEITFLQPSEIYTPSEEQQEESIPPEQNTVRQPVNETPVHPVEPVLGTTPLENHWLHNRHQTQDITDILGRTSYEGYV